MPEELRRTNMTFFLQLMERQLRDELDSIRDSVSEGYEHHIRNQTAAVPIKAQPLSQLTLSLLKDVKLDSTSLCSQPTCPVCSDDHTCDEVLTELPCGHVFHSPCVIRWLEIKYSCPVCRYELTIPIPSIAELEAHSLDSLKQELATYGIVNQLVGKTKNEIVHILHKCLLRRTRLQEGTDIDAASSEELLVVLEEERATNLLNMRAREAALSLASENVPLDVDFLRTLGASASAIERISGDRQNVRPDDRDDIVFDQFINALADGEADPQAHRSINARNPFLGHHGQGLVASDETLFPGGIVIHSREGAPGGGGMSYTVVLHGTGDSSVSRRRSNLQTLEALD